ncbi:MAG TPA: hypothetical protein VF175_05030 [Lacipirellula sp.]
MRTVMAFSALLASALLASIATAQESDDQAPPPEQRAEDNRGDRPGRPNREEMRRRMLERFDADGDGELSDEEREKARQEMRNRRDRGEGRRRGEGPPREPGRPGPGPGAPPHGHGFPPNPMRLFNAFDENQDEQLSKHEFEKLMLKLREMAPPPGGPHAHRGPRPDGPGDRRRHRDGEGRPDRPRRPQTEPSEAPAETPAEETAVDATT